jgi:hypothetical protein
MKYTIYNPNTGEIVAVLDSVDPLQIAANLEGQSWIEGTYDSTYVVVNGQAVKKSVDPGGAFTPHQFDYSIGRWVLDQEAAVRRTRQYRNSLLDQVDRVNPVRYATLTDQQKTELATYRQALLDVPQQMGFPTDISWPAKPAWL